VIENMMVQIGPIQIPYEALVSIACVTASSILLMLFGNKGVRKC